MEDRNHKLLKVAVGQLVPGHLPHPDTLRGIDFSQINPEKVDTTNVSGSPEFALDDLLEIKGFTHLSWDWDAFLSRHPRLSPKELLVKALELIKIQWTFQNFDWEKDPDETHEKTA